MAAVEERQRLVKVFFECVSDTLCETLGTCVAKTLFSSIERKADEEPEDFAKVLGETLGCGARIVERLILKNLYSRLGLTFREREGYSFTDYFEEALRLTAPGEVGKVGETS